MSGLGQRQLLGGRSASRAAAGGGRPRRSLAALASAAALALSSGGLAAASTSAEVAACIRSPQCQDVFVVAHRARGFGSPDNSRAAVRQAIAAGLAIVEIDLRLTRDGEVVVLHNARLEPLTTGHGAVQDRALDELRDVRLENGEPVPRFRDIYELTRGLAILDLHFKADAVEAVAEWIAHHGSFDDVIFYLDRPRLIPPAAHLRLRYPSMMVMTHASSRSDLVSARSVLGRSPELVHLSTGRAHDVAWFAAQGVKVAIKVFNLEGLPPDRRRRVRSWALRSGAQLILADEPLFFLSGPRPLAPGDVTPVQSPAP